MAGPSEAALEAALDRLLETDAVAERDGGTLVTTPAFESARRVYRDSYASVGDDAFRQTVADVFGVDEATAAERIDDGAITRDDLIAYLALQSFLDTADEPLAAMASLVVELSPASPVPDSLTELDDEEWRAFLDDHPDAVVTVWRHDCAPCESLKEDLDSLRDALPESVALAGVDGESVPAFRQEFEVDTAPAVCCFVGGTLDAVVTGRQSPETYAEQFDGCY
ncbi:thioredoxin family protein [Haloplanus halobius]|uniref:thioredoxin family protein n=1 Tax=Haloplanus halobius TaxID=2934938 RepID=UPI00200BD28D|nr:thioredoxin family protein [Haloplanus sp. XH21]